MRVQSAWQVMPLNTAALSTRHSHHFLRAHQQNGDIDVCYISTDHQLVDIFIKPLDEKRFCKLRSELNVLDSWNLD
jgi:hypothetical protein